MSFLGEVGSISSFRRKEYDVYYWKIDGFTALTEKKAEGDFYISHNFHFKDQVYWLRFYPNGIVGESGFTVISLVQNSSNKSSLFHLTMGVKTHSGRIEKCFSSYTILNKINNFCLQACIRQSELLRRKKELVSSDCLTFVLVLSPDKVEIIREFVDRNETGLKEAKDNEEQSEKKGGEKVLGDMAQLLTSGDQSDATIVVREAEFKVHSCILTARTPVFAALFEHDTLEKATRKITIADCESAVFKEFLYYIYTGSVQNLNAENSLGIYRVADKYLVKDLKEVCRECIQDNLCTETFCEAVQLALRCEDKDLLESAIVYCAENLKTIVRSVEWQRYIEENPREANEILIRSLDLL